MVLWDKVNYVNSEIESGYTYQSHCYILSNILNPTAKISITSDKKVICRTS